MKKAVSLLLGTVMGLTLMAGSAFAETPLNKAIDDVMGTPYVYAGTTTDGFDCSGFTMYIFNELGIDIPHSSKLQDNEGYWIPQKDLRPGDLVFFNTDGKGISHVGIYVGDGYFVHSAYGGGVQKTKLSSSYYAKRYVSARRVIWDELYNQVTKDDNSSN